MISELSLLLQTWKVYVIFVAKVEGFSTSIVSINKKKNESAK